MDSLNTSAKFDVRSFTHSGDNRGYFKNLGSPWIRPRSIFSQIFNRLFFAWTLWIYLPNLTFVALPIPDIIGGTSKIWGVPGFAHAPCFPTFLKVLCSHGPCEYICQSLKFVALPVPEIIGGIQKNWAVPGYAHAPFSPKFFMGLCSGGPCEYTCQICSPY